MHADVRTYVRSTGHIPYIYALRLYISFPSTVLIDHACSGESRTQNLWGQLVGAARPSHICYSKISLVLSKPVGPDGPTDCT
jgi:hypothetical protein